MEVSILVDTEFVSSTGLPDDGIPLYDSTVHKTYSLDEQLVSENKIYQRTAETFYPPAWDAGDEAGYAVGDIIFKDGNVSHVDGTGGSDIILQPEEYGAPTGLGFGSWNNRYAKIGTINSSTLTWSSTVNGVTHSLRFNGTSWLYKIKKTTTSTYWGSEQFNIAAGSANYFIQSQKQYNVAVIYGNVTKYNPAFVGDVFVGAPEAGLVAWSDIRTGSDGVRYRCGGYKGALDTHNYFGVQKEITASNVTEVEKVVSLYTSSVVGQTESLAYCYNSSNCANEWFPRTIIRRGNDLYIRTDGSDAAFPIQTKTIVANQYSIVDTIDSVVWGWTYTSPTIEFAPLDGKTYTAIEDVSSPITYSIKSPKLFDTIAMTGLIADQVVVEWVPDGGTPYSITLIPENNRDVDNRLPTYSTTAIGYADEDFIGTVNLTLTSTSLISIGGIYLGQRVNAGFTNLTFGNKFKDYSPYEQDQFGNILYVSGVKTNVYNGTVDINLTNYDMTNRLMESIGGETVILNGSDTTENSPIDNTNFFASTMVVGRIKDFALKTKLDGKLLSQMATYSFTIESGI